MADSIAFEPFPFLSNGHLMTIVPALWLRRLPPVKIPGVDRLFQIKPRVQILARCHFAADAASRPTLIILHGLEGSSDTPYVLGMTHKALDRGMNVVRMNLRNCGDTLHLTPTLYNAGLSEDLIAVATELKERDGLTKIFAAGYSLGGNIVLKAASELGKDGANLFSGIGAVSPALDLELCVQALERGFNRFYEQRFLFGLKSKVRIKQALFPEIYDISKLNSIRSVRGFDDTYTCVDAGYKDAAEYYEKASALPILHQAQVPILIIASKDDPIVPFVSFESPQLRNPFIKLLATEHGGHSGFLGGAFEKNGLIRDRFWAENRIVDFCLQQA